MEFCEKLQQLRKKNNLTQEQLAAKLCVSRAAISKWETGNGYPSIDSLKEISRLFEISIDDLLSGEELITLADHENQGNMNRMKSLLYGQIDLMTCALMFLPLYGNREGDMIRSVTLFEYQEVTSIRSIYFIIITMGTLLGVAELIAWARNQTRWMKLGFGGSIGLYVVGILFFTLSRQPYATSLLFLLFLLKIILVLKFNPKQTQ